MSIIFLPDILWLHRFFLTIITEDTTEYEHNKLFTKLTAYNSGLHYYGINIVSPIKNKSKINQILQTIIPLDGELKNQVFEKRRRNCIKPSNFDDEASMSIIEWGERFLTVMIAMGDLRYRDYRSVIIDLYKEVVVDPKGWFKDSLQCLTYKSAGETYNDYFVEDGCERVFQTFFTRLSKAGKVRLRIDERSGSCFIDDEEVSFYQALISPSDEGINFHIVKANAYGEYLKRST